MGILLLPLVLIVLYIYDECEAIKSEKKYQEYLKDRKERLGL